MTIEISSKAVKQRIRNNVRPIALATTAAIAGSTLTRIYIKKRYGTYLQINEQTIEMLTTTETPVRFPFSIESDLVLTLEPTRQY